MNLCHESRVDHNPNASPDGQTVESLRLSVPMITNLCFGGADHRTAFITCSGTGHLIAVDWPRPNGRLAFSRTVTT
jgi:gluconolactonase